MYQDDTFMLYRKYRPQTFKEVVGQEHVVKTLQGALVSGRVAHAFLFAGPRGTGKTTLARIFAKAINCPKRAKDGNPCDACQSCLAVNQGRSLDLVEIDAASNRGIDEIRALKESAQVASLGGGHKVFILDEVHMLSKEAFNALLKILEEPPSHVVLILATTEAHKLLPTVLSRVQRFDFRKLNHAQIIEKLRTISDAEKTKIDDEALMAVAISSDGAMRDAEVALTKVFAASPKASKIGSDEVNNLLGLIPFQYHPEFLGHLMRQDRPAAINFIQKISEAGFDPEHFTKDFLEYLRKVMIMKINPATLAAVGLEPVGEHAIVLANYAQQIDSRQLVKMMQVFSTARAEMKNTPILQLPLELAVLELCTP